MYKEQSRRPVLFDNALDVRRKRDDDVEMKEITGGPTRRANKASERSESSVWYTVRGTL